jgi:hypothetical protein
VEDVVFAVGSRPTLSLYDAGLLARFLELAGFPAMSELAGKVRDHIRSGNEIRLDRDELTALAHLFSEAPELLTAREFAAFRRLNDEVVAGLEI